MNENTESCDQSQVKLLRTKIDWLNLTLHTDFSTEIEKRIALEKIKRIFSSGEKTNILSGRIKIINSVVCFITHNQVRIEFEGMFFKKPEDFLKAKKYALDLKKEFGEYFSISRIDIAKDFENILPEQLVPNEKDNHYSFKYEKIKYGKDNESPTTIYLKNDKFVICVYRKDIEVSENKNQKKKELLNSNTVVSRFELRLNKQQTTELVTKLFYTKTFKELKFCELILANFAQRKTVRIPSEINKKKTKWEINPIWDVLFFRKSWNNKIKIKDIKYSRVNSQKNYIDQFINSAINRAMRESYSQAEIEDKIKKKLELFFSKKAE